MTTDALREALARVKLEQVPPTPELKEQYFMQQVAIGEQLSVQGPPLFLLPWPKHSLFHLGPEFHIPSAMSFFRALRVYPSPVELMMIYQKTVAEPIFKVRKHASPVFLS